MHNFSIFLHQIDGKWYEFGYYEYTGDDFAGDMAKLMQMQMAGPPSPEAQKVSQLIKEMTTA